MVILNEINSCKENTLVSFSNVLRVHPYQLHNWYIEKKIEKDYFTTDFIPLLRKFYYDNNNNIIWLATGAFFEKHKYAE